MATPPVSRFPESDTQIIPTNELEKQADVERVEEYKFLRNEIEGIWGQTYTTLNFLLAFIGLVVAAAFSKELDKTDRVAVLLGSSVVTFGGYFLIQIHTGRVWRITTYMRQALEPRLKGIAWETRLAARNDALREANANNPVDHSLFDGHMLILHMVNVMLCLLVVWTLLPQLLPKSLLEIFAEWLRTHANPWLQWSAALTAWLGWLVLALMPLGIAWLAHKKFDIKRGSMLEMDQYRDWRIMSLKTGKPVYRTPPDRENPEL